MGTFGLALVVGGMALLFSGLIFLIPVRGQRPRRRNLSKTVRSGSNGIFARCAGIRAKIETCWRRPAGHPTLAFTSLFFRELIALTVRFNFRATKIRSIFDSNNARSCASSTGVHGRPVGRGPVLTGSRLVLSEYDDGRFGSSGLA